MDRNLDGCYFRVCRDGKWCSVCFSDMTLDERKMMTGDKSAEWWGSMANHLADCLRMIGDHFGIVCED